MTEPPDATAPAAPAANVVLAKTAEQIAKAQRADRLAKALRDNLRRRKAVQPRPDKPGH